MTKLNERIKSRRLALGLTLAEIAEQIGVKEATVQRYESGEIKNIKHETIAQLAEVLRCSPTYLMGWSDEVKDNVQQDAEKELLRKFQSLDEKGKHTVVTVLNIEYYRVNRNNHEVIAAHTDDYSEEQLKLMRQDIDEL